MKKSKSITFPFKIPLSRNVLKWLANFLNVRISERVPPNRTIIPQWQIDIWDSERHKKDDVETLKSEIGFHIKHSGPSGHIYYVNSSERICECYWEFSGVPTYDIIVWASSIDEWFLPAKKKMSAVEKNEIIERLKIWLVESKINAELV